LNDNLFGLLNRGWQNWVTISTGIQLKAGEHILRMFVKDAGFNIYWMAIAENPLGIDEFERVKADIYPNPVTNGIVNVKLNPEQSGGIFLCMLTDILGDQVFSKKLHFNGSNFQMNIFESGKLRPGVYFLNILGT
jgi:hypothetical protein